MPKIEWTSDLETGIPDIDNQHKVLFSLINELSKSIAEKKTNKAIQKVTENLTNYVLEHFAVEEALMEDEGYPKLEDHKSIHQDLVIKTAEIVEQYKNKELEMVSPLVVFIANWINTHIKKDDMDFINWLKNH